jgi:hypothetical protein
LTYKAVILQDRTYYKLDSELHPEHGQVRDERKSRMLSMKKKSSRVRRVILTMNSVDVSEEVKMWTMITTPFVESFQENAIE